MLVIAFVIGWILTPWIIAIFLIAVAIAPFSAIYHHEPAGVILILFCFAALVIPQEFASLYVYGALMTIGFMLLSAIAAAAFAFVASHPDEITIYLAAGIAILIAFVHRKSANGIDEQQPHSNVQQLAVYDPRFGFAQTANFNEHSVAAPTPPPSSPSLRTGLFTVFARLRPRFSRPLRAGDLVECVMPVGDLVSDGLYTVRSRDKGYVRLWEMDGGWEAGRFRRH